MLATTMWLLTQSSMLALGPSTSAVNGPEVNESRTPAFFQKQEAFEMFRSA